MNSRQAREILMRYRPGVADDSDPELAQALEQAARDPELGRWFEHHRAFQNAVRDRFTQLSPPAGLKDKILAQYRPAEVVVWWQRPDFRTLAAAAAAAIVLLVGLAVFRDRPREDQSFLAFRNRIVRNAQRGYAMDITTTNLDEIRRYLAAHEASADYVLPGPLQQLPGDGGAVVRWQNRKVSMVCFDSGNHNDLYLFVARRSDLPDAPAAPEPEFSRIGKLTTASWSTGDKVYVLAGKGDEQFLRRYLR